MKNQQVKQETLYVLSSKVISIAQSNKRIQTRLQLALRMSDKEIEDLLKENSPYGKLNTVKAVDILQQETGIPPNQILVAHLLLVQSKRRVNKEITARVS